MQVAVYARVSKEDQSQDPENQLGPIRDYCRQRGWTTIEYVDHLSGSTTDRPAYQRMMEALRTGQHAAVVVWKLDRVSREGPLKVLEWCRQLQEWRIELHSYTEPLFTDPHFRELIVFFLAWFARWEREMLIERTRAGMAKARAQGKTIGRRRLTTDRVRILELYGAGRSIRQIARALHLTPSTAHRRLQEVLCPNPASTSLS